MGISVIGLGKLGSPLAAVLAFKGYEVVGVDLNEELVHRLAAGNAPVQEPQLQELIDASRARLRSTNNFGDAVSNSVMSFLVVPTPSDSHGTFTNQYVVSAVQKIGKALRKKPDYHVLVITSTVMPGSCDGEIREAIESSSGRRIGVDMGLCYNPEFIALGSVVRNMLFPDMILIGESDPRAGDVLEEVYRHVCDKNPPVQRMSLVNAEVAKIAVNTYVTTKITYANMLSEICEKLPGADVGVVTSAIGMDSRIGGKYLQGAVGYGGPCFPRDNIAFTQMAKRIGARADLAEATHSLNRYQIDRLFEAATRDLSPDATIGVLGLSYKPDTGVIEESQGLALVRRLASAGYNTLAFDPLALSAAGAVSGDCFVASVSAEECVRMSDRVVITTSWPQFREIDPVAFARQGDKIRVVDCWRILPPECYASVCSLVYLGRGPAQPEFRTAWQKIA